jgi:hypothetical protein
MLLYRIPNAAQPGQATGRFDASIYVIAVVMAVSLVFPLIAKRPRKKELTGSAVASAA